MSGVARQAELNSEGGSLDRAGRLARQGRHALWAVLAGFVVPVLPVVAGLVLAYRRLALPASEGAEGRRSAWVAVSLGVAMLVGYAFVMLELMEIFFFPRPTFRR